MSSAYSAPVWLFNVEGTLADPGSPADERFLPWFLEFAKRHDVRLVSELDYRRIVNVLGEDVLRAVRACYATRGNSVWVRGQKLHEPEFQPPAGLMQFLEKQVSESLYPMEHESEACFEHGVLRLKVLGSRAESEERKLYAEWDSAYQERKSWAREIVSAYPKLEAEPVGQHYIDIYPEGCDKSQVLGHINGPVTVVGLCMEPRSNDHRLAQAAVARKDGSTPYHSANWTTTAALLQSLRASGFGPAASSETPSLPAWEPLLVV